MSLSGDLRGFGLTRLAAPMNAVLLVLVVSLVFHWGLASSLASANEAPRPSIGLERITPVEAENHLALVRSGAQNVALLLVDQRLPSASVPSDDREGDQVAPRDPELFLNSHAAPKALRCQATICSPRKAFQARAPPAIT
jgi:hypothetical protein